MYVTIRDLVSLVTISLFLTSMFTWVEILKLVA